jgi:hypothetical protein
MAHHPFKKLGDKLTPEQRAQADAREREMLAELLVVEIRQLVGLTQEEQAFLKDDADDP